MDLGHAFTKFHLRPNLGATGCSFYGELGSVASLSPKRLLEYTLKARATEWRNSLGCASSLGGGTVHHGANTRSDTCVTTNVITKVHPKDLSIFRLR